MPRIIGAWWSTRDLADTLEKHGAGVLQFQGMTRDILLLDSNDNGSVAAAKGLMNGGWDISGSGAAMRTSETTFLAA